MIDDYCKVSPCRPLWSHLDDDATIIRTLTDAFQKAVENGADNGCKIVTDKVYELSKEISETFGSLK